MSLKEDTDGKEVARLEADVREGDGRIVALAPYPARFALPRFPRLLHEHQAELQPRPLPPCLRDRLFDQVRKLPQGCVPPRVHLELPRWHPLALPGYVLRLVLPPYLRSVFTVADLPISSPTRLKRNSPTFGNTRNNVGVLCSLSTPRASLEPPARPRGPEFTPRPRPLSPSRSRRSRSRSAIAIAIAAEAWSLSQTVGECACKHLIEGPLPSVCHMPPRACVIAPSRR